jgi:hypothetical protein
MKEIEINVHWCDNPESRAILISEDATIEQLFREIRAAGIAVGEPCEDIVLWVDNKEVAFQEGHILRDLGFKHGHHVHFKRRHHKHPHEIKVEVLAPRSPEPKWFIWAKTKLVGEAAAEAAKAFGYTAGHPGFMKKGKVLDNQKTLEAAGVRDCDRLELTDTGGGV